MERIITAFSSDKTADKIKDMLEGTAYLVNSRVCRSGAELLREAQEYDEALIIMGFKLPDMTVNDVFDNIHGGCKLISIVKPEHIENILYDEILALPLPVSRNRLIAAINMLLDYIPEHKKISARGREENKLIERAKLILMDRYHMNEQQAHRFIQKRSMDTGAKFADTARAIINIID